MIATYDANNNPDMMAAQGGLYEGDEIKILNK